MSITITVTDPTPNEAYNLHLYFRRIATLETTGVPTETFGPVEPELIDVPEEETPIELDAALMPWDSNIHASSKSKTTNGLWKAKRGSKSDTAPSVDTVPPPPPVDTVPPPPTVETVPPPPTVETLTFGTLVDMIMQAKNAGQLTIEGINQVVASVGAPSLPALAGKPELIPLVKEMLGL